MAKKTIKFDPIQSYLELARANYSLNIVANSHLKMNSNKTRRNIHYAIISQNYIFAYLSIVSYVNYYLYKEWVRKESSIHSHFPNTTNFEALLRNELRDIKEGIKELCVLYGYKRLSIANPTLWSDILNVVKVVRDNLIHLNFEPNNFNKIMQMATQRPWNFPANAAQRFMEYFYSTGGIDKGDVPDWVYNNKWFKYSGIRLV